MEQGLAHEIQFSLQDGDRPTQFVERLLVEATDLLRIVKDFGSCFDESLHGAGGFQNTGSSLSFLAPAIPNFRAKTSNGPAVSLGQLQKPVLFGRLQRQHLVQVTDRQVGPAHSPAVTLAQCVNTDRAAERGWTQQQVGARAELPVRGAPRALLGPRDEAPSVELADDELSHRVCQIERSTFRQTVTAGGRPIELGPIALWSLCLDTRTPLWRIRPGQRPPS